MKQYKKPLMKIVELEKVDVLTASCARADCTAPADETGYCSQHPDGEDSSPSEPQ